VTDNSVTLQLELDQALIMHRQGQLDNAERLYRSLLERVPRHFGANRYFGLLLLQKGQATAAATHLSLALQINGRDAAAHHDYGVALAALGKGSEALQALNRAIGFRRNYPEAFNNRGLILHQLGRLKEALASFDQALVLKPNYDEAMVNKGVVLFELQRIVESVTAYDMALRFNPSNVMALNNRSNALNVLGQYAKALNDSQQALSLQSAVAEAHNNQGNALSGLGRPLDAIAAYNKAIELRPDYGVAFLNRAKANITISRFAEAQPDLDRAMRLRPDAPFLFGTRLHNQMMQCQWSDYSVQIERLQNALREDKPVSPPFPMVSLPSSAADQLSVARQFVLHERLELRTKPLAAYRQHERIRIAYVSGDLREHATSYLAAGVFENHDRQRFEIFGISLRPEESSFMGQRVKAAFDRFVSVDQMNDQDVVRLMREMEIDIAVDLHGFTKNSRPAIFAARAAPLQVNWLGFPGTTGSSAFDYIIADKIVIPEGEERHYAEAIAYMPDCYQPNDLSRPALTSLPGRADAGLPEPGFVFCGFSQSFKITPDVFDVWMRLLRDCPNSVLWLLEMDPAAQANLAREATVRGVLPERLIFAPRLPLPEHLARHQLADIFLDTWPYNAHTSASDALWCGVPVLTFAGATFAGRVAASILTAAGQTDLITSSLCDYEQIAMELARDPVRLAALRTSILNARSSVPLFDIRRFTCHLENLYTQMHELKCKAQKPRQLTIVPGA